MSSRAEPRRVVHLVSTLNIGGLEMVVLDLVRHLDRSAFRPHVLCLGEVGALAPRFEALGVPAEGVGGSGKFGSTWGLVRKLRALRPAVLHTHNMTPHIRGALAAPLARVPVLVHTKHGRNYTDRPRAVALNRFASRLSDCVVAVSEDAAEVALRVERVPARKVRVIRNGIELGPFDGPAPGGGGAIHVARLNVIKDQPTLLRAARIVADARPDFRLDLVGDGPERAKLEPLCDELALRGHVRFLGFRDDVPDRLRGADLFVLSSVSEGLSLTLLEAMAAGLPIVATDVGGNREVVAAGETGLLVPARDPEALAAATLRMLGDPELAGRMGLAGRRRVEREFDLRAVVARYEALYRELLASRGMRLWPAMPAEAAAAGRG